MDKRGEGNLKVAYVIHWNEGPESGVFKKVISQMAEWKRIGREVALFVFSNNRADVWTLDSGLTDTNIQHYDGWYGRYTAVRRLSKQVRQWSPDLIYHRFDLYYPALHRLLREFPSVLEVNTNDLAEMRMEGKLRYMYHLLTRKWILSAVNGYVFVSKELSEQSHYRKYVNNHIVIGNGIDMAIIPHGVAPTSPAKRVKFVFIGSSGQLWHGIDKIAQMAALEPNWSFDMIGMYKSELNGDVPANMNFHGKLTSSEYLPIMLQADVAIGTLALYRKQMAEASPLKVREYLAYGIPVIIGYSETDFPMSIPFILELPNEPNNIGPHIQKIRNFIEQWRGRRIPRELVNHLDTKVKEATRVSYMLEIVRQGARI